MDSNSKKNQIKKCKQFSKLFWNCLAKHSYMENVSINCGKEFYELLICINKIQ